MFLQGIIHVICNIRVIYDRFSRISVSVFLLVIYFVYMKIISYCLVVDLILDLFEKYVRIVAKLLE